MKKISLMNPNITNLHILSIFFLMLFGVIQHGIAMDSACFPPKEKEVEIYNLQQLNSKGIDFCAVPYGDGIVFTSSRSHVEGKGVRNFLNKNYFDLYYSEKNETGNYLEPQKLKGNINGKLHDGTATFNQTGNRMIFTRNNQKKKGLISLKIYEADLVEGQWINVVELPFNSNKFSNCHPTLSKDETKLFFASDRPGGFGGMDIYVSNFKNGRWSEPENLGINVNSAGNELFPFVDKAGDLYFSSNGAGGFGKLDIYKSVKDGKRFFNKENLGAPFNTSADDFSFFIDENGEQGFLSSNRSGGLGNDDVYGWKFTEKAFEENLTRRIIVKDEKTGELLKEVEVAIEQELGVWSRTVLDGVATGMFLYEVKNSEEYLLKVEKDGYKSFSKMLDKKRMLDVKTHIVYLKRKTLSLLSGTVEGQIYQDAMEGVEVELLNECNGRKQTAKSDKDGSFGFTIMCGCEYIVIAKKKGFLSTNKIIGKENNHCGDTQLIKTKLQLRPAPNGSHPRASLFDD